MTTRYTWVRRGFAVCLLLLGAEQAWRHGHDYVFARQFAVVEPGKIYRGAWQKDWPMRRIVSDCKIRTILALAHPGRPSLSVSERSSPRNWEFAGFTFPSSTSAARPTPRP